MPGRSCYFYADKSDLKELLDAFRMLDGFKYVQMRSEPNKPTNIYDDAALIIKDAMAAPGNPYRSHSFLVMECNEEIHKREIHRSDGSGILIVSDQNNNWNSIVLAFGGNVGNDSILMSDINTIGDTYKKKFKKLVLSKTIRVGKKGQPYHLMPGALKKLKAGWHLTQNRAWAPGVEEIKLSKDEFAKLGCV